MGWRPTTVREGAPSTRPRPTALDDAARAAAAALTPAETPKASPHDAGDAFGSIRGSIIDLAVVASEGADGLGERRLLVGGLVRVDDTLGDGLVELLRRGDQGGRRGLLVVPGDGLADPADVRLELGLHSLVAQAGLLVGTDALDLGLDVRHVWTLLCVRGSDLTGRRGRAQLRDWGVGTPAERSWD